MSQLPTKYPYTKAVRKPQADGTVKIHWYYNRHGKRTPLDGEPGSVRFDASWRNANASMERGATPAAAPKPGVKTFLELLNDFQDSRELADLAPGTRDFYRHFIRKVTRHAPFAPLTLADLEDRKKLRPLLHDFRDAIAATPASANAAIKAIGRILSWAQKRGVLDVNHAGEVEPLAEGFTDRSGITIPPDLVARIMTSDDVTAELKRVIRFALLTAARVGDIGALRWRNFDGEWLVFTPTKTARSTGVVVHLPVLKLRPLKALFDEVEPGAPDAPIFTTPTGREWRQDTILKHWHATLARLGMGAAGEHNLHPHDMRGTAITTLYEAGCTDTEVCSISGHLIGAKSFVGFAGGQQALRKYVARSREFAVHAYEKLDRELEMRTRPPAQVLPFRASRTG